MVQLWEMGVSIMVNLRICIAGYTDTVSVYVNDDLLMMSSLIMDAKYTYSVSPGVCKVRITKCSEILNKQWEKSSVKLVVMYIGYFRFYIREAMLEANISSICFNINVTDIDQTIDVKLKLNSSGFEIVHGIEKCSDTHIENKLDNRHFEIIQGLSNYTYEFLQGFMTYEKVQGRKNTIN